MSNKPIKNIAVVGGTHGNELSGVYTIKYWQDNLVVNYPDFQIELLLANEAAIAQNCRYLETDLNRCFKQVDLDDKNKNSLEQKRAKEINQQLGPKGSARVDFIIDLHTSTANMRTNIVLIKTDEFHLMLAAYLKSVLPDVVVTFEFIPEHYFLSSIAEKSLLIEIGPIPQGSLEFTTFEKTNAALTAALEFVEKYNQNQFPKLIPELGKQLDGLSFFDKIYFPTDNSGDINAIVHPNLIHKDYSKIKAGDAIFKNFSGQDVFYQGEDAYIAFVNEAAYYDQKIAMCLCRPESYSLIDFQLIKENIRS